MKIYNIRTPQSNKYWQGQVCFRVSGTKEDGSSLPCSIYSGRTSLAPRQKWSTRSWVTGQQGLGLGLAFRG